MPNVAPEALQAIAQTANAEAVLSGRVFTQRRSGVMVLPQAFWGVEGSIAAGAGCGPMPVDKATWCGSVNNLRSRPK